MGWSLLERGDGFAQLVALRSVLGVIDDEIFAAGERQRIVERLWLGARVKVRHHHDLDIAREIEAARYRDRLDVDRLQDQLDVELRSRIVEARERGGERGEHIGLAVQRHEDGVDRKLGIRNARPGVLRRRPAQQIVGGEDAKRDHRQEEENERKRKRAEGGLCLEDERGRKAREEQAEREALPECELCLGAPVRKARMEAVDRSGRGQVEFRREP